MVLSPQVRDPNSAAAHGPQRRKSSRLIRRASSTLRRCRLPEPPLTTSQAFPTQLELVSFELDRAIPSRTRAVASWLGGIIVNLLTYSGFYDIALRDFGLMVGALTLARLASKFDPPGVGFAL